MATTPTSTATASSGLDVASIVSQLMTVEQRPLNALTTKEASYQAKLSAYGTIQGALSSFQNAVSTLNNASKFQTLTASSSDSAVTASVSATAATGTFSVDVTQLAKAQKLVAVGQTSATEAIGSGTSTTLTFDFGTISGGTFDSGTGQYTGATFTAGGSGSKTVTIDSTNNTLQGIRDAINSAGIGVTAAIINDGSGNPYRLTLSSDSTGEANSIRISVSGDATLDALLANDPAGTQNLAETTTAQNAELTVNGIPVSKSSNTVSDVIEGVTLNLKGTTTSGASVTVSRDSSGANSAVSAFVKAYNALDSTLKQVSAYDPTTQTSSILQGDATVRTIQYQIRAALGASVQNTGGSLTTLSQIGVAFQKDGSLALDTAKLSAAVNDPNNNIATLFATVGNVSDSLISFSSAASGTKAGSYSVYVSQLATQGSSIGSLDLTVASTTIDPGTSIKVTLDGKTDTVALTEGSYTASELATMIQSAINGTSTFSSDSLSVSASIDSNGFLNIVSSSYGSTSAVSLADVSGTTVSTLMGTETDTAGLDAAGTIDGMNATGSGQFLTAVAGNATGLKIQVNGGSTGVRGTVNYSQGIAHNLDQMLTSLLGSDGTLSGVTKGINSIITDIGKQRDALNARLADTQARLTRQYSALDTLLTSMNVTSNYLTQQLGSLPKITG
jgi:flagellar hook-associated protein 2